MVDEKHKHLLIGSSFCPSTICGINDALAKFTDDRLTNEKSETTCPKCLEAIRIFEKKFDTEVK